MTAQETTDITHPHASLPVRAVDPALFPRDSRRAGMRAFHDQGRAVESEQNTDTAPGLRKLPARQDLTEHSEGRIDSDHQ